MKKRTGVVYSTGGATGTYRTEKDVGTDRAYAGSRGGKCVTVAPSDERSQSKVSPQFQRPSIPRTQRQRNPNDAGRATQVEGHTNHQRRQGTWRITYHARGSTGKGALRTTGFPQPCSGRHILTTQRSTHLPPSLHSIGLLTRRKLRAPKHMHHQAGVPSGDGACGQKISASTVTPGTPPYRDGFLDSAGLPILIPL